MKFGIKGGYCSPKSNPLELALLRRYHARIQELKRTKTPKGDFKPAKGPYAELYNQEVAIMKRRINPGDTLLDAGAGYGRLVEGALEAGAAHVMALEPDQNALNVLSEKFGTDERVEITKGFVQDLSFLKDKTMDIVAFVGNNLGMMWGIDGEWDQIICEQKEAIQEMIRVARREVAFIVYGKATIESSLKAYEPLHRNIIWIHDGLMLVEEKDDKPYRIGTEGAELERFVFQKFDRQYLEQLLKDVNVSNYSIVEIPKEKDYGYLVTIQI